MKHVSKGQPPREFEDWQAVGNADWQPAYANLQSPQKQVLHRSLLAEQGCVCCYCGRRTVLADSHIEHFRPQELHQDLALSYGNLHASCLRETLPGMPLHCGHAKGGRFDESRHLSPLDPQCEDRFVYTLWGDIAVTEAQDQRAGYMVDLLKLDIAFLRNRRQEILNAVFDKEFLHTATPEELVRLCDAYRAFDTEGRAPDFGHVVARFAQQRLDDGP